MFSKKKKGNIYRCNVDNLKLFITLIKMTNECGDLNLEKPLQQFQSTIIEFLTDIVPFIIVDDMKLFYYRGLKEWKREKGYLIDTCLSAQDKFKTYLDYFRIDYDK